MPSKKTKKNTQNAQVYIGPSIPSTMLQRYSVFRGELHSSIDEVAKKVPAVKRLIVNVNEMASIERKLADKTSVQHQAFVEIINHIKGVKL